MHINYHVVGGFFDEFCKLNFSRLDNGANINEEDIQGFTALHVAAESNEVEIA